MEKDLGRNISILEYFNQLQIEYKLYELRTKIFPYKADKEKYKQVLEFKREKIEDISHKNNLSTIFDSEVKDEEITNEFYDDFGIPKGMSKRDKYFYYYIGSDFVYEGNGYKLSKYNLNEGTAVIEKDGEEIEVDIKKIKRIL